VKIEDENRIEFEDGSFITVDSNGRILIEILKELRNIREIAESQKKWRMFREGKFDNE